MKPSDSQEEEKQEEMEVEQTPVVLPKIEMPICSCKRSIPGAATVRCSGTNCPIRDFHSECVNAEYFEVGGWTCN